MNKPARTRLTKTPRAAADTSANVVQAQALTRQRPEDGAAWRTFANALLSAGELPEARAAAQRARELEPDTAAVSTLLGEIETRADRDSLARDHFLHAIKLAPTAPGAHYGAAKVLLRLNDVPLALHHINLADEYAPNDVRIRILRSIILSRSWKNTEAATLLERLVREDEKNAFVHWSNLANVRRDLGQLEEAERCYGEALKLSPRNTIAHSNLVSLMHYMPQRSREDILQACKNWGAVFAPETRPARPAPADKSPDRPLRIGLFSDGFRQHPVGAMTIAPLEHLVKLGFEIFAYTSSPVVDAMTERMMALSSRWTAIGALTDEQFAQRLRDDRIDIVIDLAGHSAGTRMRTMALEPAPVLVKWVGGLINTTGVDFIDYLITDGVESPADSDPFYTEKLIRMPDDYICYLPPAKVPDVGPLPALRNGYVTFGCFNNPTKINEVTLEKWAGLMLAVPGSRLFLKGGPYQSEELVDRITNLMGGHGIDAERLRFEGDSHHFELFSRYNEVDIALDPWPYSGGLTTCEALLMGVPVVTLPGPTFAGRHSATHLTNAGLPELVVSDWDEYQARVVQLAGNLDTLRKIRTELREVLLQSPVCRGDKYARHLADALRAVWQRYCDGKAPASLAFTPEGRPWFEDEDAPVALTHPAFIAPPPEPQPHKEFRFSFEGKIIVLDHGGSLVGDSKFEPLVQLGGFEVVAIDPASRLKEVDGLRKNGYLQHYYPHIALGDGAMGTLHACLDDTLSSMLEPLPKDKQAQSTRNNSTVLATLPVPTTRLDDVNGLERVDWLVLDDTSDSAAILNGAQRILSSALLVEVGLRFVDLYQKQPNLGRIGEQLADHGFRLLRLSDARYHSHFPDTKGYGVHSGSQLMAAKAVFIPDENRIQALDTNQQRKLALILDAAYGCVDLAFNTLSRVDESTAQAYLNANDWLQNASGQMPALGPQQPASAPAPEAAPLVFDIPSVPHMEPEGQALLNERLRCAKVFLEYGSGGSSVLASGYPLTRIYSVDSDRSFLRAVADKVKATGAPEDRYLPIFADIGPTKAWGYPASMAKAALWPRYVGEVWNAMADRDETPDLILIDGRFRVASFLISALMAPAGCVILFDDYFDRAAYHVVERFIAPRRSAGRMAEFVVPARRPDGLLPALMHHCTNPA
ncbi:O-linked N-acetylglucosamine transferase family protein [Achromobacter denitrificans]